MPRFIIDTREKKPYDLPGETLRKKLDSGDYSVEGQEDSFAIERKSLADWVNTVVYDKKRFTAELRRLQSYRFAAVVIEASIKDILAGNYESDINPRALLGITCGIMQAYSPVHIVFAGDRPHAFTLVCEMLKLAEAKYGSRI